jgi:ankyrin repeat protein
MTPREATRLLFESAKSGDVDDATTSLKAGAKPNARDGTKKVPLHFAAEYGQIKVASILIKNGANVNARNSWRSTPLHVAAQAGNGSRSAPLHVDLDKRGGLPDLVRLLLNHGADPNAKNILGRTPRDFAVMHGNDDIVEMMDSAGQQSHASRVKKRQRKSVERDRG